MKMLQIYEFFFTGERRQTARLPELRDRERMNHAEISTGVRETIWYNDGKNLDLYENRDKMIDVLYQRMLQDVTKPLHGPGGRVQKRKKNRNYQKEDTQ